jgi:outer membrane protein OmpA-like peptidoglycan-associated protein
MKNPPFSRRWVLPSLLALLFSVLAVPTSALAQACDPPIPVELDPDGDCLPTGFENEIGLDPNSPDTDEDGIRDNVEQNGPGGTSPLDADTDDDGLLDGTEDKDRDGTVDPGETSPVNPDSDGDGLLDGLESGLAQPENEFDTDPAVFRPDLDPSTKTNPLDADTDDGTVSDGDEDTNKNGRVDAGERNPVNVPQDDVGGPIVDLDSDDDGRLNDEEGTADTDGDGLIDSLDPDSDNDGVRDGTEAGVTVPSQWTDVAAGNFLADADPTTTTDPKNPDTDGDGLKDGAEDVNVDGRAQATETAPTNPDTDGDSLSDGLEVLGELRTNPLSKDTDADGLEDAVEDADKDGRLDSTETNPTVADTDGDALTDGTEVRSNVGTNPLNPDTDADGLKDGEEDADKDGVVDGSESNPTLPDTDFGGIPDGEEVFGNTDALDDRDDFVAVGRGCSSAGAGTFAPLALLMAALVLLRGRRSGARASGAVMGGVGSLLLAGALAALPAQASEVSQAIDAQGFKPGPGARDILGVQSARVAKHKEWNVGLTFNYAKKPLNFMDPRTGVFTAALVDNQFSADLMGSYNLFDRLELGVVLPVRLQSSEAAPRIHPSFAEGVSATGLGDLRLVPKANLLGGEDFALALAVPVVLPTGGGTEFRGGKGVGVQPRLVAEYGKAFRVAANIGVNFREEQELRNLHPGNELAFGVGAELPFTVRDLPLAAEATLVGAMGLKEQDEEEVPLEVLAALKYRAANGFSARFGGGPGITRGYGTPSFRLLAGIAYSPVAPPPPARPVDADSDGIVDGSDACPTVPETANGFEDSDGCPDEVPAPEPEPVDTDSDGIVDGTDRCATEPEDKDGFEDADGCPDPDNDKDGIADGDDQCPAEQETINGVTDEDGCPDKGKVKVRVESERIVIEEKVYFATNKDVILERSYSLLAQVAQVLRANPHIELVRVEGHTDDVGTVAYNQDLSQRRANNVRARLIEEGIAPERLEAVGYGKSRPVDPATTAAARENNRRVEFIIVRQAPVEVEQDAQ